jgi:Flp pilus assembly protein TadD
MVAFEQALALEPDNTDAMRGLGNTLIFLDRSALAIPHFERALALKDDPRLYNGMGVAFDMLDDYKAAQAFYRVGLKSSPNDPSLRNNLALSLLLSGKAAEAALILRDLSAQPEATTRHRLNFALSLVLSGDTRMAEKVVRMDLDSKSADEQIALFETIKALGSSKDARAAIRAQIRGTSNEFMHPRREPLVKMPNR